MSYNIIHKSKSGGVAATRVDFASRDYASRMASIQQSTQANCRSREPGFLGGVEYMKKEEEESEE